MAVKMGLEAITIPGGFFDEVQFRRVSRNVRAARAKDIKIDFDVTAQTFDDPPKAVIKLIGDNEATITMTDQRYSWVNDGTEDHMVPKAGPGLMRFQTGYKPKTIVRSISSQSGGAFGPTIYRYGQWKVKGIEPRHFDEEIAKKWNNLLPGIVERAILAEL